MIAGPHTENLNPDTGREDQETPQAQSVHREIRSFVRRGGRMGSGQRRAIETLAHRYVLPFQLAEVDWNGPFGRLGPRVLEIGFGMGAATAEIAALHPDTDFIAVDVHEAGVGALLKLIGDTGLDNIRIVQHDAVEVLRHMVAAESLAGVHIYFPDPWPKKRHHKRRLIQPGFVSELVSRMSPGAYLHIATDWEPYAHQMLEVLSNDSRLRNRFEAFSPRPPWRPRTKFEQRGIQRGHAVWDLMFLRR